MQKITNKIFQSYLRCQFKAFLLLSGQSSKKTDYEVMCEVRKRNYIKELAYKNPDGHKQADSKRYLTDLQIESDYLESKVDAAVRVFGKSSLGGFYYEPVQIIVNKLISKEDEALIGFQGVAFDLRKCPFDEEYRAIVSGFSHQLRDVINTIDNYGLKQRFLRKHKKPIERYFSKVIQSKYRSELACQYQKRFAKIQDKLFVFMDHDGIPWNNNNAEHAIKHFATYRRTVDGQTTEFGLSNYLKLLSIYQSCQYRGINFLNFLLSKEKTIFGFLNSKNQQSKRYPFHDRKINLDVQKYNWVGDIINRNGV